MDALRQEIAQEFQRPRIDRDKLYGILTTLTQIVEEGGLGGGVAGPRGPAGPEGPQGPRGKPGADGTCACKCVSGKAPEAPVVEASTSAPKKTTRVKKATA